MQGEIIAIGNELTSGRISNTTSGFAARHLYEAGYEIYAMHTIGDSAALIGEALKRAISRVDFVLVTGGLGSTDDDLTTEAVSKALDRPTIPNLELLSQIRNHLDTISASPINPLEKLAWLPQGAEALTLQSQMSGYLLIHDNKPIFFLPGVPYQMQTLLLEQVIPRLATLNQGRQLATCQRMYKIFGLAEAEINRKIVKLALDHNIHIGYYPVFPEVHLSLTVRTHKGRDPLPLFEAACRIIETNLGRAIYGSDNDSMASVTGQLLHKANLCLATAESCTGGLIAHLLTRVAGSSLYFLGGVVAYANSMKTGYLDVDKELLASHGAVSKEVAEAMAAGIRSRSNADITLAVTGIAGPDGGTTEKPVGTVYISMASKNNIQTHHFHFAGNRHQIQEITAKTALDLVRHYLLQQDGI
ncbi:MAG: CinA family nicotinamide mononucleotide deamidase-related protein [Proteobacteria bacterium]|nr:CinA family nicotinamide mononucleotide deamidase-related protein [Pseudomonadota bacterium]MBU1650289.1 CinA family nicotinamide mononucleotide deamidase-related protein [Pseudomonadota bacterium]